MDKTGVYTILNMKSSVIINQKVHTISAVYSAINVCNIIQFQFIRTLITSDLCFVSPFNYSAVQNSHKRGVAPPQHDFGPYWLKGAACAWAEGFLPHPPPPATPP